jgi:hypothetical protein
MVLSCRCRRRWIEAYDHGVLVPYYEEHPCVRNAVHLFAFGILEALFTFVVITYL